MLAQFTPQTLLTRFTEIMTAGENLVETDLPQSQLGSLLNLAADAQEHTPQRLTLGAPDFGSASELFSTYPDFGRIHARVDQLIAAEEAEDAQEIEAEEAQEDDSQTQPETEDGPDGGENSEAEPPGPTPEHDDPAVAEDQPAVEEAEDSAELTQPDGSPLSVEYLIEAQDRGEVGILEQAASTNGECTPAE